MQLTRAVSIFARANAISISNVRPSECADTEVSRLWEEITRPNKLAILQEWSAAEVANQQPSDWTEQAIRICRERAGRI
jgi:hypothetical protein